MFKDRKILLSILGLSIVVLALNALFIKVYLLQIQRDQAVVVEALESKLNYGYNRAFALINMINYSLSGVGLDQKHLDKYFSTMKEYLTLGNFNIVSLGVTAPDGKIIYSSKPCMLTPERCTAAKREYFIKALREPEKEHFGDIVSGIVSIDPAIPLCKAFIKDGNIEGVTVIGLDIQSFLNSRTFSKLYTITLQEDKNVANAGAAAYILLKIFNFQPTYKTIKGITYKIDISDYDALSNNLLWDLLPWNLILISLGMAWQYTNIIRKKFATLFSRVKRDAKYLEVHSQEFEATNDITQAFDSLTKILFRAAFRIKDYKQSINNLEKTVDSLLEETDKDERELSQLNREMRGLISDKSINLNDEYICVLEGFTQYSAEHNLLVKEQLTFIKQILPEIKNEKEEVGLEVVIKLLKKFVFSSHSHKEIRIRTYIPCMELMFVQINDYFGKLCLGTSLEVEVVSPAGNVRLVLKGQKKAEERLSQNDDLECALLLHKIKLCAQISGFTVVARDSESEQFLELHFTAVPIKDKAFNAFLPAKLVEVKV